MLRKIHANITRVMVTRDDHSLISTSVPQATVTFEGFEGDKHAGFTRPADGRTPHYPRGARIRNDRQVSLVSEEELALIAAALGVPMIEPEWLGANLLVSGLPQLTLMPPATRLFFANGVVLAVSGENEPCLGPGKVIAQQYPPLSASRFPIAALHRRGLVAVVEKPGVIHSGETVIVEIPEYMPYVIEGETIA
ncbi:MAG: MOSC domain-containing protein [Anaerolineales bacterium]